MKIVLRAAQLVCVTIAVVIHGFSLAVFFFAL